MNKQDFLDWKRHPVTQLIYAQLASLVEQGKEELVTTAGADPVLDARKAGKITAFQDILETSFEDIE